MGYFHGSSLKAVHSIHVDVPSTGTCSNVTLRGEMRSSPVSVKKRNGFGEKFSPQIEAISNQ